MGEAAAIASQHHRAGADDATRAGDFASYERTQEHMLTGFHLVERCTAPDGFDDTFWKRRRKL